MSSINELIVTTLFEKMPGFIYRCPFTGSKVQDWLAEGFSDEDTFISRDCPACTRVHLVNASTGRVAGENKSNEG